jgi:hypothetical protein
MAGDVLMQPDCVLHSLRIFSRRIAHHSFVFHEKIAIFVGFSAGLRVQYRIS